MVFYFFTSSKPSCLVTAAITAALFALPSNGVTWLTPRMRAHQIWRLSFPVLRYSISPFFPSAHRGQRRYHVKKSQGKTGWAPLTMWVREIWGRNDGEFQTVTPYSLVDRYQRLRKTVYSNSKGNPVGSLRVKPWADTWKVLIMH
jgi:hypothetical protein